jgi:hypothetical protein
MKSSSARTRFAPLLLVAVLSSCGHRNVPAGDGGAGDGLAGGELGSADLPAACAGLSGAAKGLRVSSLLASRLLIPDRLDRLYLLVKKSTGTHDLYSVPLPKGTESHLESELFDAEWLDDTQKALLLRKATTTSSSSLPYNLLLLDASGVVVRTVAKDVCGHTAAPDGSRVYVVRSCDTSTWTGSLEVVEVKTLASTTLASKVHYLGPAVSADSKWAAYTSNVSTLSCGTVAGDGQIVGTDGKSTTFGTGVLPSSLQFLKSKGSLLYRKTASSCTKTELRAVPPASPSSSILLTQARDFANLGLLEPGQRYAVSSDETLVLAADAQSSATSAKLYAVRTDGAGETLLASDLYPYFTVSAMYEPWASAATRVLYTRLSGTAKVGLAAMTWSGGSVVDLTTSLLPAAYLVSSAHPDDVAYVDMSGSSSYRMNLASAAQGTSVRIDTGLTSGVSRLAFSGDGRGVLFVQLSSGSNVLWYGARAAGKTEVAGQELGRWSSSVTSAVQPDGVGCLVAFASDLGSSGSGTYVTLIPR